MRFRRLQKDVQQHGCRRLGNERWILGKQHREPPLPSLFNWELRRSIGIPARCLRCCWGRVHG
jgi:hypothetical protein